VNGSHIPGTGQKSSSALRWKNPATSLLFPERSFEIPVRVSGIQDIGAFSLIFSFPGNLLEFLDADTEHGAVIKNAPMVLWRWSGRRWSLCTLLMAQPWLTWLSGLSTMMSNPEIKINLLSGSEIADPMAFPLMNKILYYPHIKIQNILNTPEATPFRFISVYPNPASDLLNLDYHVSEATTTCVTIINSLGLPVLSKQYPDAPGIQTKGLIFLPYLKASIS